MQLYRWIFHSKITIIIINPPSLTFTAHKEDRQFVRQVERVCVNLQQKQRGAAEDLHTLAGAVAPNLLNSAPLQRSEGLTALYHNHQRNYIGTELTIATHDCGISSPALSFSQAVHKKTVILHKSYLPAYLNNHSPIPEGTL